LRAPWKLPECYESRDSFAKSLFDNMFNWLVDRMNLTILPDGEGTDDFKNKTKTIGLLDIFGFECFDDNKFE
jgi:myosin heavy subunit